MSIAKIKELVTIDQLIDTSNRLDTGASHLIEPCPICNGKGHFYVTKDMRKFISFSCTNDKGDVVNLYMVLKSCNFKTALKDLTEMAGFKYQSRDREVQKTIYASHLFQQRIELLETKFKKIFETYRTLKFRNLHLEGYYLKWFQHAEKLVDEWAEIDNNLPQEEKVICMTKAYRNYRESL